MASPLPSGAYAGESYAVFVWDDGDRDVDCLYAGPSLGECRKVIDQAERADPTYDHIELVSRVETFGAWQPYSIATSEADAA